MEGLSKSVGRVLWLLQRIPSHGGYDSLDTSVSSELTRHGLGGVVVATRIRVSLRFWVPARNNALRL